MTLFLDNSEIAPLLDPSEFVETLDAAYKAHAFGRTVSAPRLDLQGLENPRGEIFQLGVVAGLSERYGVIRLKSDMVFQRMIGGQLRKEKYCTKPGLFMGLILLFDLADGALLSIMQDGLIQKLRVGVDSALGIRYLAQSGASRLGVLGAGGMARSHIQAIASVRQLDEVRIFSPTRKNREALALSMRQDHGISAIAVDTDEEVYRSADMLCACTSAIKPVVRGALIEPGTHITAIGGGLDAAANARLSVALRLGNANDPVELPNLGFQEECMSFAVGGKKSEFGGTRRFANPPDTAKIELRTLLDNPKRGRINNTQITFSERGNVHGLQFAAVAGLVYEKAIAAQTGRKMPDEIFLEDIRN